MPALKFNSVRYTLKWYYHFMCRSLPVVNSYPLSGSEKANPFIWVGSIVNALCYWGENKFISQIYWPVD